MGARPGAPALSLRFNAIKTCRVGTAHQLRNSALRRRMTFPTRPGFRLVSRVAAPRPGRVPDNSPAIDRYREPSASSATGPRVRAKTQRATPNADQQDISVASRGFLVSADSARFRAHGTSALGRTTRAGRREPLFSSVLTSTTPSKTDTIRTLQQPLGHDDMATALIHTHALHRAAKGAPSTPHISWGQHTGMAYTTRLTRAKTPQDARNVLLRQDLRASAQTHTLSNSSKAM